MAHNIIRDASNKPAFMWDSYYGPPPQIKGRTLILDPGTGQSYDLPFLLPAAQQPQPQPIAPYQPNTIVRNRYGFRTSGIGAEEPSTAEKVGLLALLTAPLWLTLALQELG
jgi:hypothetical protein